MRPYYEDGFVKIYHGDAREVVPSLPKADLLLTDPPYVVGAKGCGLAGDRQYLKDITAQRLDQGFDISFLANFDNWFCFVGKQQLPDMLQLVNGKTWMLITWNKPNPTPLTNNNYLPDTEYIIHQWQVGRLFGEYRDKSRFINWPTEQTSIPHPTVKPLSVIKKLIRLGSLEGDLILDPFCGSGSTLRAAKDLNRKALGVDVNEAYCEIAARRCNEAQPSLYHLIDGKERQGLLID